MVVLRRTNRLVMLGTMAAVAGVVVRRRRHATPPVADRSSIGAGTDVSVGPGAAEVGVPSRVPATIDATGPAETAPAGSVVILDVWMGDRVQAPDVLRTEADPVATTARPLFEESAVPPGRHRLSGAVLAAIAAAVGLIAIGLGGFAFVQSVRDEGTRATASVTRTSAAERVVSLLSKPSTARIPVRKSVGRIVLVVGAKGLGVLVLDGLGDAPAGKSYQAWVIRRGAQAPASAAVFSGREVTVPLTRLVPRGATVAITLERAGGTRAPTRTPKLTAQRA